MQIEIQDDFDLKKISISGQCFRVKCFEGERYRFISGDKVIYIQQVKLMERVDTKKLLVKD